MTSINRRNLLLGAAATALALPVTKGATQAQGYDRTAAALWAHNNAFSTPTFETDCTFFVSQALWAGGLPRTHEWTDDSIDIGILAEKGRIPGPTRAAAHANTFVNYLVGQGWASRGEIDWSDNSAFGAQLGDIIAYDWNNGADGIIDHVAIVTDFTQDGPIVSQHTPPQNDRYWSWSKGGNGWIEDVEKGSKAHLIYITFWGEMF